VDEVPQKLALFLSKNA